MFKDREKRESCNYQQAYEQKPATRVKVSAQPEHKCTRETGESINSNQNRKQGKPDMLVNIMIEILKWEERALERIVIRVRIEPERRCALSRRPEVITKRMARNSFGG